MVLSEGVSEQIKKALADNNGKSIQDIVTASEQAKNKRIRKTLLSDIQNVIIDTSFKTNKPGYLESLSAITEDELDALFLRVLKQYILTKNEEWLSAFFSISEKIDKKSTQSKIFAIMAEELISAGVTESEPVFIERGLNILDQINFRKYRSESMINIIPHLIVWGVTSRNTELLTRSLILIEDISDISKRSVLHAEIALAMSTIAVYKKDPVLFYQSIRCAVQIPQKLRRQECILAIIEKGSKSLFSKDLSEIYPFVQNFKDIPPESRREIISALTEKILDKMKDKTQIKKILDETCKEMPFASDIIILDLLKKAEKTGDNWFLAYASELQQYLPEGRESPVREIIRAGISVAKNSADRSVLTNLVPVIDKTCSTAESSKIYLQFTQVILESGDFNRALEIFRKVSDIDENTAQYTECLAQLLKTGVFLDSVSTIKDSVFSTAGEAIAFPAINKAIHEINRDSSFDDIVKHLSSYITLILLHPDHDHLIHATIAQFISRGFLDTQNPDILVRLSGSIKDKSIKERAISTIVIKIAQIGVQTKNRDFLQRAVGIACLIEDQNTSSSTMSTIIDEAAVLAASQGDLDLLLRMKVWSSSLLDTRLIAYAMANIIGGIIKYATDKNSYDALEEAYTIAKEINDPSLKIQLCEKIAETFIKIGCGIYRDSAYFISRQESNFNLLPFTRGLDIIKQEMKNQQVSLKIASMIDIILGYSKGSTNPDYLLPLALYTVEIEHAFERDAMMARVVTNLNECFTHPDSADPYEIMAYLIQKNYQTRSNPQILDLDHKVLNNIVDPFTKLNSLCSLAELCTHLQDTDRASEILGEIDATLPALPSTLHKILILSSLVRIYSGIDQKKAESYLDYGLSLLNAVEAKDDATARRQLVYAIVSMNAVLPEKYGIDLVIEVIKKITDPLEYIDSLIAAHEIIKDDHRRCAEIIEDLYQAVQAIPAAYDKASVLIEIIPLAVQCCNDDTPQKLMTMAENLAKKVNIGYIADTLHDDIARFYFMLYQKNSDTRYIEESIRILKMIDNDEIRITRLQQMGYTDINENGSSYLKIKALSDKIINDNPQPNTIAALERLVRAVPDRGKQSGYFCDLAIVFWKKKEPKLSRKMIQNAIGEAEIIRPLSRRAYIMCDMAMKTYAAGCDSIAQEIIDYAMDAATNIRQSAMRDDVFNELGMAMKIMQAIR